MVTVKAYNYYYPGNNYVEYNFFSSYEVWHHMETVERLDSPDRCDGLLLVWFHMIGNFITPEISYKQLVDQGILVIGNFETP